MVYIGGHIAPRLKRWFRGTKSVPFFKRVLEYHHGILLYAASLLENWRKSGDNANSLSGTDRYFVVLGKAVAATDSDGNPHDGKGVDGQELVVQQSSYLKRRADDLVSFLTSSSALRLCVWLFNDSNMQIFYVNEKLLFTLGAKKRKVSYLGINPYLYSCFTLANWTVNPLGFYKYSPRWQNYVSS